MIAHDDTYLIWSHEHRLWWGRGMRGYVERITEAGRFDREEAVNICADAIARTAPETDVLLDLPVRLADLHAMRDAYRELYPDGQALDRWD